MTETVHTKTTLGALRLVAIFEAIKGLIVIAAGFGLLTLLHRDVRQLAVAMVTRLHLDPERRYAGLFIDAASHLTDTRLLLFAALALGYTAVRWVEAYGLWMNHRWAAWLGAAGGAIYVPIELYELWRRPTPIKTATLLLNVAIVAYLLWTLWRSRTVAVR